ncbi:MAG TPA: DUF4412 domain-containing protein [Opitutaceae bacterium]
MITLRPCFTLAAVLFAATVAPLLAASAAFEGKIKMQMKSDEHTQLIDYSVKPNLMRMDMPLDKGTTATSIMDFQKKEMIMLMPGEKMYMVMPIPDAADETGKKKRTGREATFENTGETEKVLGYLCTKFISKDEDNNTYEIWAAEGLGTFMGAGGKNPMKRAPRSAWETELAKKGFFPLRMTGKNAKGKEIFNMEALAVEKQTLPDTHFAPPAGYERFDMGGMLKGMANPFGGR